MNSAARINETGQAKRMRILNTADWHIGRQFHNVSLLQDQRQVLDQIISADAALTASVGG